MTHHAASLRATEQIANALMQAETGALSPYVRRIACLHATPADGRLGFTADFVVG